MSEKKGKERERNGGVGEGKGEQWGGIRRSNKKLTMDTYPPSASQS